MDRDKHHSWLEKQWNRTAVYAIAFLFLAVIAAVELLVFRRSPASTLRITLFFGLFGIGIIEACLLRLRKSRQHLRLAIRDKDMVDLQLRQQRTALDAAANAIIMTDRQGIIFWVNPAFSRLTGFEADEAIGNSTNLLNSGQHDDAFFAELWRTILSGQVWQGETINRRKDGSTYVEEQTIAPVIDSRGEITHFISIKQDITARQKAYENERNQRMLAEVLRDVGTALSATLDFDAVLDKLLLLLQRIVPYDAANLILIENDQAMLTRARSYEKMDPDFHKQVEKLVFQVSRTPNLQQIVSTGKPKLIADVREEPDWQHDKSSSHLRSWLGIPVIQENSVIAIFALESTQVDFYRQEQADLLVTFAAQASLAMQNARLFTEARQHAQALDQLNAGLEERVAARTAALAAANERLQQLDRLKSKFVADVSHELRTPITNLSIYLDLLERGKPDKRDKYVDVLQQELARLRKLVEDVLNLSRLEMSKLTAVDFAPLDVNRIAQQVVDVRRALAETAGLELQVDLASQLPQITGSVSQLEQAIDHLVTNALNYTHQGSVTLRTYQWNRAVCVEVTDSGIGIAPDDLPHIFERFYRGRQAGSSNIPGTGLGLGIVQEIAQMHHGEVKVESIVGQGATFTLEIPIDF